MNYLRRKLKLTPKIYCVSVSLKAYHQEACRMGHYRRETTTSLLSTRATTEAQVCFCAKNTPSLLTNGYLSSFCSQKQPNQHDNKIIAVSETRINLLFHCISRIFSDAYLFLNDLRKTANFTIWDYSTGEAALPLMSFRPRNIEMIVIPDDA